MSKLAKALSAAAGNAGSDPLYVEDVFRTFLYEGNGGTQSINNGIDLAGEGGLVWVKNRDSAEKNVLSYGANKFLSSNETSPTSTNVNYVTQFNNNGFNIGAASPVNTNNNDIASWTFRKAEKFFDYVEYSGNGVNGRALSHNLGSVPAMAIIKRTNYKSNGDGCTWLVWHKDMRPDIGLQATAYLNTADDVESTNFIFYGGNGDRTATTFGGLGGNDCSNETGGTYIAYLFASDAGGFGDDEDENIIKCGSYTTDSSGVGGVVNVGFEPEWIFAKSTGDGPWMIIDVGRGWSTDGNCFLLNPNTTSTESTTTQFKLNSNGFQDNGAFAVNTTIIYMAIRRPMKTPESGTEVFQALSYSGTGANAANRVIDNSGKGFYDSVYFDWRYGGSTTQGNYLFTRLPRRSMHINASLADAPWSGFNTDLDSSVGFNTTAATFNGSGQTRIAHGWRRRPKVHDVVHWVGNGSSVVVPHALEVTPEILIFWSQESYAGSNVFSSHISNWTLSGNLSGNYAYSNQSGKITSIGTSSFTANSWAAANSINYVGMLWSTLAGVSKCGSYSGSGGTQTIDCGFSNGPRFILIRRTDKGENEGIGTSNNWIWDSVRGINNKYLALNTDLAEGTSYAINSTSAGFQVINESTNAINTGGGTYLFLAIA